ncbi:MAG: NAD(P)H-hydrate dehydratase [Opitutus sp.]|nr:NAD(P)H-hydrate dehydratase [Opitutus sp.]
MSLLPSHPILSCADAKSFEASVLPDEAAEWAAMQRAGGAIACAVLRDFREIGGLSSTAGLLVLVGKGHNGGDALLATRALLETCPDAHADIVLAFGEGALRPLARRSLDAVRRSAGARVRVVTRGELKSEFASYELCLDGLFGFQFRPPLDGATSELLAWVNTHPRIRLRAAVDLPSGLAEPENAKTVFRADFTYCTGIVKSPVVAPENAALVGRARYLDLGFFDASCRSLLAGDKDVESPASRLLQEVQHAGPSSRILLLSLLAPLGALRPAQSDKRTYGHLLVVGGSRDYPGAVLMTVQAALRSGVGLLTACVPESLVPEYAAKFPEAMWCGFPETAPTDILSRAAIALVQEKAARATALVIGPGLGSAPATLAAAEAIVRNANLPVLLDADALQPEIVCAAHGKRLIATPHAGEWQRVSSDWPREGAVLVRKGCPTVVVAGSFSFYSFCGGPVLARGGSGDLLAGLIGGLLAQKPDDLWLAAARGVVWHGLAADLLARDKGQVAVQTTQLLDYLHPALHTEQL